MAKAPAKKATGKEVVEVKKKKSTAVVTHGGSAPPAALTKRMAKDAGRGISTDQDDNLIPLIYILQSNSPQVNKRGGDYLEGAEPGSVWLRNAADPIVDGEEGILVQPCAFSKDFVEWVPRDKGGGFVGRHASLPADVKQIKDEQNPNKVRYVRKNGNEVIETRYHVVRVFTAGGTFPYVIPFTSTGHTVSRQWTFMMNSVNIPDVGKPSSFAKLYRLKTKHRTNAAGEWFSFAVEDAGWVEDEDDYNAGDILNKAFSAGEKAIAAEDEVAADDTI